MRILLALFGLGLISCQTVPEPHNLLQDLVTTHSDRLGAPAKGLDQYEVQIIYTQIDRNAENRPSFTTHTLNVDDEFYFYPASTIKMPTAVLALEKIRGFDTRGINKNTPLTIDAARDPQTPMTTDDNAPGGMPTIAHFIQEVFVVSDNNAHNRLYEFLGQEALNSRLNELGFSGTQITHRIGGDGAKFDDQDNRYTTPFRFAGDQGTFEQPEAYNPSPVEMPDMRGLSKGVGYMEKGELIEKPKDFSTRNRFSLTDMERFIRQVIFPDTAPPGQEFDLTDEDYEFLHSVMSMRPDESAPHRNRPGLYDSYVKFFMFGDTQEPIPDHIRIFNKVGWAYGYLTDVAYIVDLDARVEFILAATISVNANQVYNDDTYEYETIGLPFMSELGHVIYDYELKRPRQNTPDLSRFKF